MIEITNTTFLLMLAHCQSAYPLEACGFLGGRDGNAYVVSIVENKLRSPVAYEMEPRQQIEAMLTMENEGLDLVAAYHSHPHGPSRPSASDMAQAFYPDLPQIIVSLQNRSAPAVGAFLLTPDIIRELSWRIV